MMMQTLLRYCAVALVAFGAMPMAAQANVLQADLALRGQALGSSSQPGLDACQAACSRTPGCAGFNFDPAAKATCSLLGGTLSEMPFKGVQSCRMPCDGSAALTPQPLKGALVADALALKTPLPTKLVAAPSAPPAPVALLAGPAVVKLAAPVVNTDPAGNLRGAVVVPAAVVPAPPPPVTPAPGKTLPSLRLPAQPLPVAAPLLVGTGISDITGPVAEVVMMGYAKSDQSAAGLHMRLYARAFVFAEPANGRRVVFVSAELGQLFSSIKQGVIKRLAQRYGSLYDDRNVQIAATHTHAGPGGYSHHALFNFTSNGHVAQNYKAIVDGITEAIIQAHDRLAPATLSIAGGDIQQQASINRSPEAFVLNQDIAGLSDTEKNMTVLRIDRAGRPAGAIAWFAVHNTSLTNSNLLVSSDHKGWAAFRFEKEMGSISPFQHPGEFVAAFPNGEEGDQSPNLQKIGKELVGPAGRDAQGHSREFESMQIIGDREYLTAKALFEAPRRAAVAGEVDFRHTFVSMPGYAVTGSRVSNGAGGNTLCKGAYGASFAAGAEDGPSGVPLFHEGMALGPNLTQAQLTGLRVAFTEVLFGGVSPAAGAVPVVGPLLTPLKLLLHGLSAVSSDPCQFPKPVLVPSGELGWSPEVLPFQLLRTGPVVIAGVPGEMTVQAGRRLKKRILDALAPRGVSQVILTGLANEYSAYITTPEEYLSQQYEGASTLYGRLTLDAYLQIFGQLADAMAAGQPVPAGPTPRDLGANQIELQTGVLFDAVPAGQSFGQVLTEPPLAVRPEEKLTVRFRGAHPKNDLRRNDSYFRIERNEGGANWSLVAWDAMPETRMMWQVDKTFLCVGCSLVDVSWAVPRDAQPGVYRIRHMGHWKNGTSGALTAYEGVTQTFTVGAVSTPRALNVAACGASGQRACCVSERLGFACDQGLQEGSNCVGPACTCGGPNPGGSLKSMGMCVPVPAPVHVTACGGQGQRACCVAEQLPSCNPGLHEVSSCGGGANCICGGLNPGNVLKSAGMCAPQPQAPAITACGAQGQRACCLSERFPSCNFGLRESAGCVGANCTCGGPNPGGAVKSNGMCVP